MGYDVVREYLGRGFPYAAKDASRRYDPRLLRTLRGVPPWGFGQQNFLLPFCCWSSHRSLACVASRVTKAPGTTRSAFAPPTLVPPLRLWKAQLSREDRRLFRHLLYHFASTRRRLSELAEANGARLNRGERSGCTTPIRSKTGLGPLYLE